MSEKPYTNVALYFCFVLLAGFPAGMEPVDANKKLQTSEVSTKF